MRDSKKKGTNPMPPVTRKLGPGVVVRPKREDGESGTTEQSPEYRPSEQVYRRQK